MQAKEPGQKSEEKKNEDTTCTALVTDQEKILEASALDTNGA